MKSGMIDERPRARALRVLRDTVVGANAAGQPLPPERALAEQCQVSRTTLRWALAQLAREGLLRSAGARTRLVADPSVRPAIASSAVYLFSSIDLGPTTRSGGWGEFVHLGVQQGLRSRGRTVLIPGSGIPDAAMVEAILRERPVGVVMPEAMLRGSTDPRLAEAASAFAAAGIPTVVFGETPADCDRVTSDHEAGACELSRWLIARGRRRQLCLWAGPGDPTWPARRRAGHERAWREAGCPALPIEWMRWRDDAFDEMVITLSGHLAPHLLAAEPVDCVLAMSDGHVPAICAALRRCGREPGRDVAVAGYDAYWHECPERARCPDPPLATVDKGNLEIGQAMAALLEERIAGRLPAAPQLVKVAPRLVVL